ncbi:MAG: RNA methyltransferase [Pseudomonadota bacterium]
MNKSPRNRPKRGNRQHSADAAEGPLWLWGLHAVQAALDNPRRQVHRLVASENAAKRLSLGTARPDIVNVSEIGRLLPSGAVHQGAALYTDPLEAESLDDVLSNRPERIAVLDQLADPHNLGAIFRSAAAFGVGAVILQTRHSPPLTGTVAKSAVGAVERVREVRVVNIARAVESLADAGFLTIGLAGGAEADLATLAEPGQPLAIVMGAEGKGLRPAVASACQFLAQIPMSGDMESLNVSNAAAIAFYLAARGAFSPD